MKIHQTTPALTMIDECRRFEIPAPLAANSTQEFQIEKRH